MFVDEWHISCWGLNQLLISEKEILLQGNQQGSLCHSAILMYQHISLTLRLPSRLTQNAWAELAGHYKLAGSAWIFARSDQLKFSMRLPQQLMKWELSTVSQQSSSSSPWSCSPGCGSELSEREPGWAQGWGQQSRHILPLSGDGDVLHLAAVISAALCLGACWLLQAEGMLRLSLISTPPFAIAAFGTQCLAIQALSLLHFLFSPVQIQMLCFWLFIHLWTCRRGSSLAWGNFLSHHT